MALMNNKKELEIEKFSVPLLLKTIFCGILLGEGVVYMVIKRKHPMDVYIDINKDASDIISTYNKESRSGACHSVYINHMTGKKAGRLEDVIRDRNYMYTVKTNIVGIYAKIVGDCLIVIIAEFNKTHRCKWRETGRFYIDKYTLYDPGHAVSKLISTVSSDVYDICGQGDFLNHIYHESHFAGLRKTFLSYYKGFCCFYHISKDKEGEVSFIVDRLNTLYNCQNLKDFLVALIPPKNLFRTYGVHKLNGTYDLPPVKEDVLQEITDRFSEMARLASKFGYNDKHKEKDIGYIQRAGDDIVLRCFHMSVFLYNKDGGTGIEVIPVEYLRVPMDINSKLKILEYIKVIPLYTDDLTGTAFEPVMPMIEDYIHAAKGINLCGEVNILGNHMCTKCGVAPEYFFRAVSFCAHQPAFEKIINHDFIGRFFSTQISAFSCVDDMVMDLVGDCDYSQKKLHRILQVPKCYFKVVKEIDCTTMFSVALARSIKTLFDGYLDYFMRIDEDTFKKIVAFVLYNAGKAGIFKKLIYTFGAEGCNSYLKYLDRLEDVYDYNSYLTMVIRLREIGVDASWNIPYNAVEKEKEYLMPAYASIVDEDYPESCKVFNECSKEWSKYLYKDGKFLVTYPKQPHELFVEGMVLRHCVGKYIDAVTERKSTILFIRQVENPDKHFYTLEIRNNEIRQCHGFDNCDVYKNPEVAGFLEKFCEEKGVVYSDGVNRLGV